MASNRGGADPRCYHPGCFLCAECKAKLNQPTSKFNNLGFRVPKLKKHCQNFGFWPEIDFSLRKSPCVACYEWGGGVASG